MALCWILLCLLGTVVFAQDEPPTGTFSSGMGDIELPPNASFFRADPTPLISVETRVQNFYSEQASNARDDHFYCLGTPVEVEYLDDSNRANEVIFVTNDDSTLFPPDDEVWTLVFQYPVLSYLDTTRKAALLGLIAQLAATPSSTTSDFNSNAICLGAFETFDVSEYSEGVVFRIYLSESTMRFSLPAGVSAVEYIEALDANFIRNFDDAADDSDIDTVQRFRGRPAIYIPAFSPDFNMGVRPDANVHPGSSLPENEDPTLFAVYRGSLPRNATLGEVLGEAGRRGASNPNPINFGLEAGDIVFAVFGSIFLFIVAALAVLGFVIHPFFLS